MSKAEDLTEDPSSRPDTEKAPETASRKAFGEDQAVGLRALFEAMDPALFCVACALPAPATVAFGMALAHELRGRGRQSLLVDEIPLRDRGPGLVYPVAVRYDLGQALAGDVPLWRAVRLVAPGFWFAAAGRDAEAGLRPGGRNRGATLLERLRGSDFELDVVIVLTDRPRAQSLLRHGSPWQRLLVLGADDESLRLAPTHLAALSQLGGTGAVSVLVAGGDDEAQAVAAFEHLRSLAASRLALALRWIGWVSMSDPGGLSLPSALAELFDEPLGGQA
jgi:hypothetical protein